MTSNNPTILIVHGSYGSPQENWFSWLKEELEQDGYKVLLPTFPTPEGQDYDNWLKIAQDVLAGCDPAETILVGHSVAGIFVLHLGALSPTPYRAIFSVSPFAEDLGLEEFRAVIASFVNRPHDWARMKQGARKITCVAGDNDPYVPLRMAEDIAAKTESELIVVEKGGHLNTAAGYRAFPLILDLIRKA